MPAALTLRTVRLFRHHGLSLAAAAPVVTRDIPRARGFAAADDLLPILAL